MVNDKKTPKTIFCLKDKCTAIPTYLHERLKLENPNIDLADIRNWMEERTLSVTKIMAIGLLLSLMDLKEKENLINAVNQKYGTSYKVSQLTSITGHYNFYVREIEEQLNSSRAYTNNCEEMTMPVQLNGTCWFNAILVCLFFSENTRTLVKHVSKSWDTGNKTLNNFKSFFPMYESRSNLGKIFSDLSNDYVLHALHTMTQSCPFPFDFDTKSQRGYSPIKYLHKVLAFFGIKFSIIARENNNDVLFFDIFNKTGTSSLYSAFEELKKDESLYQRDFDNADVLIIFNHPGFYINGPAITLHNQIPETIIENNKIIKCGNNHFQYDSAILSNGPHAIAGITCDDKRKVYNGWLNRKVDYKKWKLHCPLFDWDWLVEKDKPFRLSTKDCSVSPQSDYLEFNLTNTNMIYICPRVLKTQVAQNTTKNQPTSSNANKNQKVLNSKLCEQWLKNPMVNPVTKKSIKKDGPVYKKFEKQCKEYNLQ